MAEQQIPDGSPISYKLGSDGKTINNIIVYYLDKEAGKKMPFFNIDPAHPDEETAIRWIDKLVKNQQLWLFGRERSDKLSKEAYKKANSAQAWSYAIENFINIIQGNDPRFVYYNDNPNEHNGTEDEARNALTTTVAGDPNAMLSKRNFHWLYKLATEYGLVKKITKAQTKIIIKKRKEGEIKAQSAPVQRDDTPFAQRQWEAKEDFILQDEDNPEKEYFVATQKVDGKSQQYKKEVTKDQNWVRAWTRSDMIKNIADSRKPSMVTAPFKIVNLLKFPQSPFHFIGREVEYADPYNFEKSKTEKIGSDSDQEIMYRVAYMMRNDDEPEERRKKYKDSMWYDLWKAVDFRTVFEITQGRGFYPLRMGMRKFLSANGINIPRPAPLGLSGKVTGHGKYAHIKMTQKEINDTIMCLENHWIPYYEYKKKPIEKHQAKDALMCFLLSVKTFGFRKTEGLTIITKEVEPKDFADRPKIKKEVEKNLIYSQDNRGKKRVTIEEDALTIDGKKHDAHNVTIILTKGAWSADSDEELMKDGVGRYTQMVIDERTNQLISDKVKENAKTGNHVLIGKDNEFFNIAFVNRGTTIAGRKKKLNTNDAPLQNEIYDPLRFCYFKMNIKRQSDLDVEITTRIKEENMDKDNQQELSWENYFDFENFMDGKEIIYHKKYVAPDIEKDDYVKPETFDQDGIELWKETTTGKLDWKLQQAFGFYEKGQKPRWINVALEDKNPIEFEIPNMESYWMKHPLHSIRHVFAQNLLERSKWNFGQVAILGHWKTIDELKNSYGGIPKKQFVTELQIMQNRVDMGDGIFTDIADLNDEQRADAEKKGLLKNQIKFTSKGEEVIENTIPTALEKPEGDDDDDDKDEDEKE